MDNLSKEERLKCFRIPKKATDNDVSLSADRRQRKLTDATLASRKAEVDAERTKKAIQESKDRAAPISKK